MSFSGSSAEADGGTEVLLLFPAPIAFFALFFIHAQMPPIAVSSALMPPTTPPTIAPTFTFFFVMNFVEASDTVGMDMVTEGMVKDGSEKVKDGSEKVNEVPIACVVAAPVATVTDTSAEPLAAADSAAWTSKLPVAATLRKAHVGTETAEGIVSG